MHINKVRVMYTLANLNFLIACCYKMKTILLLSSNLLNATIRHEEIKIL